MTPYLERQVYSPQATAGRGIRSTVGQRFYGGLSGQNVTPTPTPMPVQRPQEAMFAPEPMPMVDPRLIFDAQGGGPGEGPDMGGPNAVSTGMISQGTADTIESGVSSAIFGGKHPTVMGLLSTPALLANPLGTLAKKGVAKLGGWMVDKAKDIFADQGLSGKQAQEFALDTTPVTNPQTGLPVGFIGPGTPASGPAPSGRDVTSAQAGFHGAPPPSSLADIGFGSSTGGVTGTGLPAGLFGGEAAAASGLYGGGGMGGGGGGYGGGDAGDAGIY